MKSPLHLQTEKPVMPFEDWYLEFVKITAEAMDIEILAATRYINIDAVKEWYDDGFNPYVTFRENFQR